MKFSIKKIDLRQEANRTLLLYLQRKIMPSDTPHAVDVGHWWVAYDEEGKPVGFAGMVRSISWYDCGYLCRAGVLDSHTGHGLQKRLINTRIAQAKKLNWKWAITDTTNNPPSANSLINAGFKLYNPTKPWAYRHSLYWRKKLVPDAV
jgi:GNAT superfamily N-acetyltransferase